MQYMLEKYSTFQWSKVLPIWCKFLDYGVNIWQENEGKENNC